MAKVNYTAIVSELTGRLAGSVFQKSVGGNILRSLPLPRNPRTQLQQRVRAGMVGATSAWRNCPPEAQLSWEGATNRERFNNYTAFNFQNMWLNGSKFCTQFAPAPAEVPEPDTAWYAAITDGIMYFFGFYISDNDFATSDQWFMRISQPRAYENDPAGEMIAYRATENLTAQDEQLLIYPSAVLPQLPLNWIPGKWINWEIIINTGTTYGTTGVITSQIVEL